MALRTLLAGASALWLAACTTTPPSVKFEATDAAQQACLEWFARLDASVSAAGVADAQETRIEAHPHLRANRFVAALAQDRRIDDNAFARDALPMMRGLDRAARAAEISNLPGPALTELGTARADAGARTESCGERLAQGTRLDRRAVRVPDDYSDARRLLGAYALTRYPFTSGVQRHLAGVQAAFAKPLAPPHEGSVLRFAVAEPEAAPAPADAAGPGDAALLDRHQPVFELEITHDDDRPGALVWDAAQGRPVVRREQPAVYRQVSFTRYRGRTLTQLVYTIWFGARPADGPGDLLAGHLDGQIWRVTLDDQGRALIYDSIHPCGCYHYFVPTERATPIPAPPDEPEWAFVPQPIRAPQGDERVVLRLATRTHFLERVTVEARRQAGRDDVRLQVLAQDSLRALPVIVSTASGASSALSASSASSASASASASSAIGAATRSAYGPDGLVPGTERAERLVLWPMGIVSAGQMRQWGRHATAFVGRRHFDDADLFDKRFVLDLEAR